MKTFIMKNWLYWTDHLSTSKPPWKRNGKRRLHVYTEPGLTLQVNLGKEVALWGLTSLSRWSKAKFKTNFE